MRLDLPSHMRMHSVIHISHTITYVEEREDVAPAVAEEPALVPTIEGEVRVDHKIVSHRKMGRGCQFLISMKGDHYHDVVWQHIIYLVDRDGTVTEVWKNNISGTWNISGISLKRTSMGGGLV